MEVTFTGLVSARDLELFVPNPGEGFVTGQTVFLLTLSHLVY